MAGTLYVVGTPIGNLEDLTPRARRMLGEVDVIACEDTRRTGLLLSRVGVGPARLVSFFAGNEAWRGPEILESLRAGSNVAVVTDAGMPAVADPGFALVRAAVEAGVPVSVIPGVSAVTAALAVSGLPSDRFVFEGFLPRRGRARRERLAAMSEEPRTVVLFESPRRVASTLADLRESSGERRVAVCRELTKLHEEVLRGTLEDVERDLARRGEIRGEVVIVLEGAPEEAVSEAGAVAMAKELVAGGMRKRDAARRAAARTGIPARALYAALVEPPVP